MLWRKILPSVARKKPAFIASSQVSNSSSSTTLVIPKPSGVMEGDILLAFVATAGSTSRTWAGDSGWAQLAQSNQGPNLRVAYKIASGSEGSSYTFVVSSPSILGGCILAYRGAAYDKVGSIASPVGSPLVIPEIVVSSDDSILIAAGFAAGVAPATFAVPTGMTSRALNNGSNPVFRVCDANVGSGPTGNRSMPLVTGDYVCGVMLSIGPG